MAWILLFVAGLFEVAWAEGHEDVECVTRLAPTVRTALSMSVRGGQLGGRVRVRPVGTPSAARA